MALLAALSSGCELVVTVGTNGECFGECASADNSCAPGDYGFATKVDFKKGGAPSSGWYVASVGRADFFDVAVTRPTGLTIQLRGILADNFTYASWQSLNNVTSAADGTRMREEPSPPPYFYRRIEGNFALLTRVKAARDDGSPLCLPGNGASVVVQDGDPTRASNAYAWQLGRHYGGDYGGLLFDINQSSASRQPSGGVVPLSNNSSETCLLMCRIGNGLHVFLWDNGWQEGGQLNQGAHVATPVSLSGPVRVGLSASLQFWDPPSDFAPTTCNHENVTGLFKYALVRCPTTVDECTSAFINYGSSCHEKL